jgi:hypothetical protein
MPVVRDFDVADILAVTHGLPVELDPYIAILAFLNERPASVLESRSEATAWIFELHPRLQEFTAPGVAGNQRGEYTDDDLAVWDAWAAQVKARVGDTLPLQPIPRERRDPRSLLERVLDTGVDPAKVWLLDPNRPDPGLAGPDDENR